MSRTTTQIRPRWPMLARFCSWSLSRLLRGVGQLTASYGPQSRHAQHALAAIRTKLAAGQTVHLLGVTPGGHNTGVALVEVSPQDGIRLLSNHEEERFRGEKHCMKFPTASIAVLQEELHRRSLSVDDLDAVLLGWDYVRVAGAMMACVMGELPGSLRLLSPEASPVLRPSAIVTALFTPRRLSRALGRRKRLPVIHQRHHDNHAAFAYAASPFAGGKAPVAVVVIDGAGDDGSISWYLAQDNVVKLQYRNDSLADSLGMMYGALSSSLGGWPILQSEGRFMGAAAWGNTNRLTNPYYSQLREVFQFGPQGVVSLNRSLARWHRWGLGVPFSHRLTGMLGPAIPLDQMWNPDAVLNVDDIEHAPITQDRVDKAAAVQLVFEDALLHIVRHIVQTTGVERLVLAGGTALNCVANMRVLEQFNEAWYSRYLHRPNARLHAWIPPTPNDEGVAAGAAFNFALQAGALVKRGAGGLQHAFYCGLAPTQSEIQAALDESADIGTFELGNVREPGERERIADLTAFIVSQGGIVGLYQGVAETGPRALGHRSILANPTNPDTLKVLNRRVKYREAIRPLAPMATIEAAQKYFELCPGAADDNFNAYNFMILTAPATDAARRDVPAVVHHDGTGRVQIVRQETDPFTHSYLKAMGRYVGAEVSVNTSLNVGSPIAQTPLDALTTLTRSGGMHGLLMIADDGTATLAWHNVRTKHKDKGESLCGWVAEHSGEQVGRRSDAAAAIEVKRPITTGALMTSLSSERREHQKAEV